MKHLEHIKGKRIMVTGGAGFIGAHICRGLMANDAQFVIAVDDGSGCIGNKNLAALLNNYDDDRFEFYNGGCELFPVRRLCEDRRIDTLVHCAANARESASQFQPLAVTKRNYYAYISALTYALQAGVRNVVMFSSMSVYGNGTKPPPFHEDQPLAPEDVYAVNKVAMEHTTAILSSVHKFNYVIIRPHNVFGELQALHDRFRNVVAIWMNLIMRGEPITIFGDGEQRRAFSYIGDSLPSFLHAIANTEVLHGHAVNVGGKEHISLNELCAAVKQSMGVPNYPVQYLPPRPLEVKHAWSTHAKSELLLDYSETIGWVEGIRRMAAWAKSQRAQEWKNSDPLELRADCTPSPWLA